MILQQIDRKVEKDIQTAIEFINKHMKHGSYQEVAEHIAKRRGIKKSTAYQTIMKVKARKQQDNEVLMILLKKARESSLELSRFVKEHIK